jgi:hypothetical protein
LLTALRFDACRDLPGASGGESEVAAEKPRRFVTTRLYGDLMDTFGAITVTFVACIVLMVGALIEQNNHNRDLSK